MNITKFHFISDPKASVSIAGEPLREHERNIALVDDPRMCPKCLSTRHEFPARIVYPVAELAP